MRSNGEKNFIYDTHLVDAYVGKRVRERRQRLSWTLMDLAEKMGVSHQQVQKYEHGTTRISAGALYQLSKIFQTNQDYFFLGMEKNLGDAIIPEQEDTINLSSSKSMNIVLIEDDAADELLMRKALEFCEVLIQLHTLHDGEAAIQFLRRGEDENFFPRADLIILDLNLPRRDGHMLLKDIKRDRSLQDMPVVVMTNSLSKKDMSTCYKNGACGYICKSFDFEVFKENVKNLVEYWYTTAVLPNRN